jgi:hypothetical protein
MKSATIYIIRINGGLDEYWSDWFDGMTIRPEPYGETSLAGLVRDQAALVGLINRIHDLGLELISVIPQEHDSYQQSDSFD